MGEATLDMDRLEEYYVLEASVPTMTAVVPLEIDVVDDLAEGGGGGGQDKLASLGSSGMRVRPEAEPWDAWLPITESRKGSTAKAVLHLVCSGIGFQGLSLPVALATLGWAGGITVLTLAFAWQLYTIWILVHLHESPPLATTRYSRYLQVMIHAFGPKLGKLLGIFPVMYLSGGSCVILIITGGGAMRTLFDIFCAEGDTCRSRSLSGAEWFLVFTCIAMAIAQFPNLNSIAGVSLVGAVTGVTYCTILSVLAVRNSRRSGVSYEPLLATAGKSVWTRSGDALYAVGTVALSFRGHNLILEIQVSVSVMSASNPSPEGPPPRRSDKNDNLSIFS
ncbi:hypothetical protein SAY87_020856 [Trapa incisa]|uniref:Amino acid transporter transmembrane domain-containing protein n=1 Tax=Trapa incisa TaxID=236973 RepID=A0AAN7PQH0_9MYRT|nr:hypothetical protein SAY87_020856 [Trapa incisa]